MWQFSTLIGEFREVVFTRVASIVVSRITFVQTNAAQSGRFIADD